MSEMTTIKWKMAGEETGSCNCDWGCPCQFNALPTTGRCEGFVTFEIRKGHFGVTSLDKVRFARVYWWPGPMHEGNGIRGTIIDEEATKEQREAVMALDSTRYGGLYWEIFAAVCPQVLETRVAPITFNVDREKRQATVRIPGIAEVDIDPIKNPVSGELHRARIELPNGFEFKEAEMGNTSHCKVTADERLTFELNNSYAQLNVFDWSN